jgi:hypothetical protein
VNGRPRGPFGGPERRRVRLRPCISRVIRACLVALLGAVALWGGAGCGARLEQRTVAVKPAVDAQQPQVRTVKLAYRAYGMARVVGDALYVSVDSGKGLLDTLVRYDLSTGKSSVLLSVPADISWVTVNDRWLLWESEKKLYAEPRAGGVRRVLATSREAYAPALEGDTVAWVDHEEGSEPRIVTFDLKTAEKREVARTHVAEFYNNFMQIRDGRLLWTDIYDGTGHYVVHDLSTGKTEDYPLPKTRFRYPGYAVMSGDSVYSVNFDRYDQWDWSTQQVGRFSLVERAFTPITPADTYVNAMVIGTGSVALIDSEQRLLVGPANGTYPSTELSKALGSRVDGVQVSSDGVTAVAGRSTPERNETTLFIFELR